MSLFPREHGAYGQVSFPLLTAFAVAGLSTGGLLLTAAVAAAFLAHEPITVLLGQRGPRAKRDLERRATRWLAWCVAVGVVAALAALLVMPPQARWWVAVPVLPALLLARATATGTEKTWGGEIAAALAFSGAAVPVCLAAGASTGTAMAVAVPFALLFISSTLAVRVVILEVRGGGNPRAASATRRAAFALGGGAAVVLGWSAAAGMLPVGILAAAAPGLITATWVAAFPPLPSRLRRLGWTLVTVSLATAVITVVAAS